MHCSRIASGLLGYLRLYYALPIRDAAFCFLACETCVTTTDRNSLLTALAGAFSLIIALGIGRFLFTPALPDMIAETDLTAVTGGYLAAINYGGYLLGAMLAMVVPAHRARTAFWLALWVSVVTSGLMGLSDTFTPWAINRFLAGIASAVIMVNGSALVLGAMPAHLRARLGSVHYAGIGLGISLAALMVALVESLAGSYLWMWLACAALAMVPLAFMRRIPALPHARHTEHERVPVNRKALGFLIASYTLAGFGYITSTTYLPVIARAQLPDVASAAFYTWLAVGLAAVPANLLWGKLASQYRRAQRANAGIGDPSHRGGNTGIAARPDRAGYQWSAGRFHLYRSSGIKHVLRQATRTARRQHGIGSAHRLLWCRPDSRSGGHGTAVGKQWEFQPRSARSGNGADSVSSASGTAGENPVLGSL